MTPTVEEIRAALAPCLERLRAAAGALPRIVADTTNMDAGYPFWGVEGDVLFFTAHERGAPTFRDETTVLDELLYWICRDAVRQLAGEAAVRSSRRKDQRRARFAREEELLHAIDPEWGDRCRAEHAAILERYPYRDGR